MQIFLSQARYWVLLTFQLVGTQPSVLKGHPCPVGATNLPTICGYLPEGGQRMSTEPSAESGNLFGNQNTERGALNQSRFTPIALRANALETTGYSRQCCRYSE